MRREFQKLLQTCEKFSNYTHFRLDLAKKYEKIKLSMEEVGLEYGFYDSASLDILFAELSKEKWSKGISFILISVFDSKNLQFLQFI